MTFDDSWTDATAFVSYRRSRTMVAFAGILLVGVSVGDSRAAEPLVERAALGWKYLGNPVTVAEQLPGNAWTQLAFDDSSWPQGQAKLGYGDADVTTKISFGNHAPCKPMSALFRRRFQLRHGAPCRLVQGRICCDDGAVVFVNGIEVFRFNMPDGAVTPMTRAARAIGPDSRVEREYHDFIVIRKTLNEGDNVIAVSVHQANATSSDLALDLELTALTSGEEVAELQDDLRRRENSGEETVRTHRRMRRIVLINGRDK